MLSANAEAVVKSGCPGIKLKTSFIEERGYSSAAAI
jgi:hypothetical protein